MTSASSPNLGPLPPAARPRPTATAASSSPAPPSPSANSAARSRSAGSRSSAGRPSLPWCYRQVVERVQAFVDDLSHTFDGTRIVVIGQAATRWAFDHLLCGAPLANLIAAPFEWQTGRLHVLPTARPRAVKSREAISIELLSPSIERATP